MICKSYPNSQKMSGKRDAPAKIVLEMSASFGEVRAERPPTVAATSITITPVKRKV
jgi:hypothetical protein